MNYLNLGFPKKSSTNIQKNFYPNIKELNYLGRYYHKDNSKFFFDFNDFIEDRRSFSQEDMKKMKKKFIELTSNKINLLSNENWVIPYQKNNVTNEIEIISQFDKLERLKLFFESLGVEYKVFIINRNNVVLAKSLFATLQERIIKLFGKEILEFDQFIKKFNSHDQDHNKMKLFFNIFNIKKIENSIGKKITIFDYEELKTNPEAFINKLSIYMNVKISHNLIKKLKIKTRVSPIHENKYLIKKPSVLFYFFNKNFFEFFI